jgi:hypothetical protein
MAKGALQQILGHEDVVVAVWEWQDAPGLSDGCLPMRPKPVGRVLPIEGYQRSLLCEDSGQRFERQLV